MNYSRQQVIEYFQKKADAYDLVEKQIYWQLSDALLWSKFRDVADTLPANFTFFDAGGGTGRWTIKLLKEYPYCQGILFDLSNDMLNQAREKFVNTDLQQRVKIIQGDLASINNKEIFGVDLCFNFHNVLGFVEDPKLVLQNLAGIIKQHGLIVSFIPNLYHAIFFNLFQGQIEEAERLSIDKIGRFTTDMPLIHFFTPDSINELYRDCSIAPMQVIGFPITIYPGYQETRLTGSSANIVNVLDNSENFDRVFNLELKLLSSDNASRGNNLFAVGKKN